MLWVGLPHALVERKGPENFNGHGSFFLPCCLVDGRAEERVSSIKKSSSSSGHGSCAVVVAWRPASSTYTARTVVIIAIHTMEDSQVDWLNKVLSRKRSHNHNRNCNYHNYHNYHYNQTHTTTHTHNPHAQPHITTKQQNDKFEQSAQESIGFNSSTIPTM